MTKIIYIITMEDKAINETSPLIAFDSPEEALEWREFYIHEEYSTEFDMKEAGITLYIEPTPYEPQK